MKSLIITATLLATQAFAYNTKMTPVEFGKSQVVEASNSSLVSLLVELDSKSGSYPLVQIDSSTQKSCAHKQTLIAYSGFDLATSTYKRTYEVQIARDASKSCLVRVFASTSQRDLSNAATVALVPAK